MNVLAPFSKEENVALLKEARFGKIKESMKYSVKTGDIRISVTPRPVDEKGPHKKRGFQFSFTVTIENEGACDVVLLERYWIVNSGGDIVAEEVGPGVAGRRPIISPGKSFRYIGEAVIDDPVGSMQGSYTFRSNQGRYFQAIIPCFNLIYPEVLN